MNGYIVLSFAVVASLSVHDVDGSPFSAKRFGRKCCLPNKYSMDITWLESVNSNAPTVLFAQMDADKKQFVMLNYTKPVGPSTSDSRPASADTWDSKILIDYNKSMLYLVTAAQPNKCLKDDWTEPLHLCIPDDAKELTTGYLGSRMRPLTYTALRFKQPLANKAAAVNQSSAVVTLAMTEDCVPIMEGVGFPDAPKQNAMYMYSNYVKGLVYPKAFELPESCK